MATIAFENVTKLFDAGHPALSGFNLEVAEGEFLVLVGPSGCGKSTALRLAAGLDRPSSGILRIDGAVANEMPPRDRNIAMVFQSYALYPHLSVAANIGFGLKVRGIGSEEIARKVRDTAALLELTGLLARRPAQLSGGQRQRVAMARALVRSPNAFLMDEPLSNLDARLRSQMREEIAGLQRRTGVTTVYVTHDQVEAMTMGHRVAVMDRGVLQQIGAPRDLYDRPANRFVAGFLGSPAMNFVSGRIESTVAGEAVLRLGTHRILLRGEDAVRSGQGADRPPSLVVGLRPEAFRLAGEGEAGVLPATVVFVEDLGPNVLVSVDIDGAPALSGSRTADDEFGADRRHVKVLLGGRPRLRTGEPIRLAVEPGAIHLFSPETGATLLADGPR